MMDLWKEFTDFRIALSTSPISAFFLLPKAQGRFLTSVIQVLGVLWFLYDSCNISRSAKVSSVMLKSVSILRLLSFDGDALACCVYECGRFSFVTDSL